MGRHSVDRRWGKAALIWYRKGKGIFDGLKAFTAKMRGAANHHLLHSD
jgi:hypothetical protein